MRKSKFAEPQIVWMLRDAEAGAGVADLLRRHQISRPTFYLWKKKYGGVGVSVLQRLKELERENARLKRRYAYQASGFTAFKDVLTRKL